MDSSPVMNPGHFLDWSLFVPALQAGGVDPITVLTLHARYFGRDWPPPVGSPTLLSLGCALNL
jgi:hypothetical protein